MAEKRYLIRRGRRRSRRRCSPRWPADRPPPRPRLRPLLERCLERLGRYSARADVLLAPPRAPAAMESAVANLCSPGDRVLVVSAGNFGERWAQLAARVRLRREELRYEWGETPNRRGPRRAPRRDGGAAAVLLTQSETSTGVVADVQALAAVARAGRSSSSTRSPAWAPSRSRPTPGASTSSSRARRRR